MAKLTEANLVTYSPNLKVLDCTLRDGGLVNNFYFTDEFVKDLYNAAIKAGIDYMEFGYKASTDIFNESDFGKWKFCNDDDIRAIVGENDTKLKLSIMADVGRCDYKEDIHSRDESPLDMIRVATYINTMPEALSMIEDAYNKGYETTCNIMAISNAQEADVKKALEMLGKSPVDAIYIVDSYGSLYPEQIRRISDLYLEETEKYGKKIGIHAHNNQQCAFANTIESLAQGVSFLDATVCGMGRGAGNCALEALVGFLKNPEYRLDPILRFMEKYMVETRKKSVWGYDIPYLLTGLTDQHPRTAIAAVKEGDTKYLDFYNMILERD